MDLVEAKKLLGKTIGEEFTLYADFLDETVASLALDLSVKILDIGTGWGVMPIVLALRGFEVLTGEPKQHNATYTDRETHEGHQKQRNTYTLDWRNSARSVGVEQKIKFQHLDAEQLPFADDTFDAVFMNGTLHHLQNKHQAIQECLRVTNQNGVITIIEGNENTTALSEQNLPTVYGTDDPRDYLPQSNITVDVLKGKYANSYIIKKHPTNYAK
jgi:SAM-dependent methyltransferase